MSFNVSTLEALQAEGLDLAACIRVLKTVEPQAETAAEKRKAWDRERKREQREAERLSGGMSGGNPPDPSPNERDILTPTRETKTEPKGSSKSVVEIEKREAIASCLRRAFPTPPDVTDEQWDAFCGQRKKKLNDRSYALLTAKLAKLAEAGWPPGEMIDLATENGWETVWPPRNRDNGRTNRMAGHQSDDGLSPTTRAAVAVFGPP